MKFKLINCEFWRDPVVQYLTPEEKLFYIYLLTNTHINQCGIYQLSIEEMIFETGLGRKTVEDLIEMFDDIYGKIRYNYGTHEVAIKNWPKYINWDYGKIVNWVAEDLDRVKDKTLISFLGYAN